VLLLRKANQLRARDLLRSLSFPSVQAGIILLPMAAHTAESPWKHAMDGFLQTPFSFTEPIALGLSLGSTVAGGLMLAFSKGTFKRILGGILFGVGWPLESCIALSSRYFRLNRKLCSVQLQPRIFRFLGGSRSSSDRWPGKEQGQSFSQYP